jgi:integrase/recombinase XerD
LSAKSSILPVPISTAVTQPGWSDAEMDRLVAAVIRRGGSEATRRAYGLDLTHFFTWLSSQGLTPSTVSPDDLDAYKTWLVEPQEGRKPVSYAVSSVRRKLTPVRDLYDEIQRRRLMPFNPAAWLRNPRGEDLSVGAALSLGQARELRERIEADLDKPALRLIALRDRAMLSAVMIGAGPRRSEVAAMKISDLRQTRGHWVITITGKGRKRRSLKIAPERLRWLTEWFTAAGLTSDAPMFVSVLKGGRLTDHPLDGRAVDAIVRHRLGQIGVTGFGAHSMRRTFGSLAHKGGASLDQIGAQLGHKSTNTTKRYIGQDDYLDHNAADYIRGI